MADKTSMSSYNKTGYAGASGVSQLNAELKNYATDDASLRKQAEAQYADTYAKEQESLKTQLSALISAQANDSDLLNKQYEQSVSSMLSKLEKRGLNVGGLPQAQTDALSRFHNEVMEQRQTVYGVQQKAIKDTYGVLKNNYEANITRRMHDNRNHNLKMANELLTNIAELQSNSYQAYIDYLLTKKARSRRSSGGSRRSYSSGSGSKPSSKNNSSGVNLEAYYKTASASATAALAGSIGGVKKKSSSKAGRPQTTLVYDSAE